MDCTTIMITHRLPVAQSADLVVVVADGVVVETGSPSALKRRKASAYARALGGGSRGRGPHRRHVCAA